MTWGAVGSTAVSVVGGSLLGGGSKKAERAAKDAAARAQFSQEQARQQSMELLSPYTDMGRNASRKLSELLGIADPEGYAPRPELQDFVEQVRKEHFDKYGKDYGRNSNIANQTVHAKNLYDAAMQKWQAGKEAYEKANPVDESKATLLKNFSNEDFVKDPGYEFRMAEGEKGIQRQLAKMGGFNSGAALKAIDRYNQDYASNEFSNAYNRDAANKARTFTFLSGSAGQGLQAAGAGIGANTNAANNNSQIQSNLGSDLSKIYQQADTNQSNMFQNAIGNGLYIWERNNRPVTGQSSVPSGGYSTEVPTYASNAYSSASKIPFWKG
jgi:hypothetical protein